MAVSYFTILGILDSVEFALSVSIAAFTALGMVVLKFFVARRLNHEHRLSLIEKDMSSHYDIHDFIASDTNEIKDVIINLLKRVDSFKLAAEENFNLLKDKIEILEGRDMIFTMGEARRLYEARMTYKGQRTLNNWSE